MIVHAAAGRLVKSGGVFVDRRGVTTVFEIVGSAVWVAAWLSTYSFAMRNAQEPLKVGEMDRPWEDVSGFARHEG